MTVRAVEQELRRGREDGYEFLEPALDRLEAVDDFPRGPTDWIGVVPIDGSPRNDVPEVIEKLDRGEAHALYRAWPDRTLASDDLDARQLAKSRDVPVTGSIGILAAGVESGELSVETADDWLDVWRDTGYYSPVDSVAELVDSPD